MPECKEEGKKIKFQIQVVADVLKSKEAKGQDASFERELLRSWAKYEGYEGAKQALAKLPRPNH